MKQVFGLTGLVLVGVMGITGCAGSYDRLPKTRDQFVATYKKGGLFHKAESVVINRPVNAVVADASDYGRQCLNRRVINPPIPREARSSTTFTSKMGKTAGGVGTLSVQKYFNDHVSKGMARGGMFSLVAEFRSAGGGKTKIDIYHLGESRISDHLKQWAAGEKKTCPMLP